MLIRKENYKTRVGAITRYVTDTRSCRSVLIGNYFNDNQVLPCGICDNCINNKNVILSAEKFKIISDHIFQALKNKPMDPAAIFKNFKTSEKQQVWTVINFLMAEEKIVSDDAGIIRLK